MVNELLDAVVAPGAVAWSTYPAPDASITRSPNSAMPLTGATLNVPDNRPPTGFTLILVMMLPAEALLGWTVKASASGPLPPPPGPLIAMPRLLVSRWSYGQAAVRSAATARVMYESL